MIFSDKDNNKPPKKDKNTKKMPDKTRDLEAVSTEFDETYEKTIRPKTFDEYIGQKSLKETLKI